MTTRTRILQIIPTLVRGGAEKQLTLLACGLPREEFEVQVCVLSHLGPYEAVLREQGIPVDCIGKRWKVDPLAYVRLRRRIRRWQPDLVHTWLFAANSYGRQAARSAGVRHLVAGERCVDRWKVGYELAIDRSLAHHTQAIVANSTGVRDFYVQHGLPADRFQIIPNGIEPDPRAARATRAELLDELRLPPDAKLIGAVGRLWPQKRYLDLIWAAELLRVARDDFHLLILGDGPQRDALQTYRDQIQATSRVHFLGERKDVSRWLPHFDCFWLASGYEGQSNALMEAMLAGVPVIVSDIPGNRDLVIPEESGLLVPRQTQRLLENRDLAKQLGAAAQQRMRSEFSVPKMINRHVELYRRLLSQ
jgi:glycosyltransferase involved in cell wall biosynthesis